MLGYVGVWLVSKRMGLLVMVCVVMCVCVRCGEWGGSLGGPSLALVDV